MLAPRLCPLATLRRVPLVRPLARLARSSLAALVACGLLIAAAGVARAAEPIDFNRQIRPLLSDRCFRCHGPDEKQRQAGLRLDVRAAALAELESGDRAIVPGESGASALVARITEADPDLRMPPADSGKTLSPDEIALLRRWIEQGAEWSEHWSFVPPRRPDLPDAGAHRRLVRGAIDHFILARLASEGLSPSGEADKVTLIRRVTFDLTGLPPTPAEIDAFLADDSPDAYERVVDRLFKSPRYGEHMARYWLDVARYGDTHGLHLDNERSIWPYRQWVIDAFNRNLPFDRFVIEQMAGDLLPQPTLDQRVATGFNRCNVTTSEGGSIDDEVLVRYATDRTETMGTVFLGLTLGCAACHDHKFDPIAQREFYQLYAFFNASADRAMDGNALAPPPILKVPAPEHDEAFKRIDAETAELRQRIADELARVEYVDPGPGDASAASGEPKEFVWIDDALPAGAQAQGNSPWEFVSPPDHPVHSGEKSHRRQAAELSQHFFTGAAPGLKIGEGDVLFTYVWLDPANPPREIMLQFNDGTWEHRAYWGENVIDWGQNDSPSRLPRGELPPAGQWVRLEVEAAKVGLSPGATLNGWAFTQFGGTVYWDRSGIVSRTPQQGESFESLAAWEAFDRAQSKSNVPQPVRDAIKLEPDKRSAEQQQAVRNYFLEHVYAKTRPAFEPLHARLTELQQEREAVDGSIPITLVMEDLPKPRDTHILVRGEYDKKGEQVAAAVPAVLPPLPDGAPHNRLGLALWLVDRSNPLTARVTMNRLWQQFFGVGIVKTAEDFGVQGEWPSHPELLDWLAVELVESNWDVKHVVKRIVMSHTYRQSSAVTPELVRHDPENRLLARGARFRMDAEVVRDTALALSGLLVEQIGGRSVRPYQPPGIWEAVGFVGSNTREFKRDDGQALYRRSLYTFWKRTAPPPALMAFDAPSRENCVARRARTNTPLQALLLMNDEQYVEAARQLALRMRIEGGAEAEGALVHGFRLATGRVPTAEEMAVLRDQYVANLAHYESHPDDAQKLLSVGQSPRGDAMQPAQHAALAMVANLLLNLDETITKE